MDKLVKNLDKARNAIVEEMRKGVKKYKSDIRSTNRKLDEELSKEKPDPKAVKTYNLMIENYEEAVAEGEAGLIEMGEE